MLFACTTILETGPYDHQSSSAISINTRQNLIKTWHYKQANPFPYSSINQIVLLIPELMRKMLRVRSLINSIFFGTQVFFVVLEGTYVANMLIRSKQMVNPAITQLPFPKLQVTNLPTRFSSCILYL